MVIDDTAMADELGGEGSSSSGVRRAATDPSRLAAAMEGRTSQDREGVPRVRFSEDLARPRANPAPSSGSRPGTPNLTVETRLIPKKSSEAPRPGPGGLARKASNAVSPTSPRTRDRGYSLRRTLFTRGIINQAENSPIELDDAGSSREYEVDERQPGGEKEDRSIPGVTVSPVLESEMEISAVESTIEATGQEAELIPFEAKSKDKKTFGSIHLPHYAAWAR